MEKILSVAINISEEVGKKLMTYFGKTDISARATPKEIKTLYDEVTDKMIIAAIEENFPAHSYLTEETGRVEKKGDFLWIVDPLDGTGNFVNNNPFFAVSISVWFKGEPLVSVIEAPALGERYVAYKDDVYREVVGCGEKSNMSVSNVDGLDKSYLIYCEGGADNKARILAMIKDLYVGVKGMRILGSAAMELMWVALGRAEAYITPAISIWDVAAGIHILRNAGGKVSDFDGKNWENPDLLNAESIDLAASNGKISLPTISY